MPALAPVEKMEARARQKRGQAAPVGKRNMQCAMHVAARKDVSDLQGSSFESGTTATPPPLNHKER